MLRLLIAHELVGKITVDCAVCTVDQVPVTTVGVSDLVTDKVVLGTSQGSSCHLELSGGSKQNGEVKLCPDVKSTR